MFFYSNINSVQNAMQDIHRVVAIGDICLDIKTDPLSDFSLGDRQFRVENLILSIGGNSANFCLGASHLGMQTSLICCLGTDPISGWLESMMKKNGVKCIIKTRGTGTPAVTYGLTHTDGTRQMITFNGPNLQLSEKHIDYGAIKKARHLHRSGFWWIPKLQGKPTARVLKFAQNQGIETSLDIATDPEKWPTDRKEKVYQALEYTDIFFANDMELKGLTGTCNIMDAADVILGIGTGIIATHLGPKGCMVFTNSQSIKIPAFNIVPKNPIGSGDTYNSGFIYGRIMGWKLEKCAKFANACAAYYMERLKTPHPSAQKIFRRFHI